MNRPYGDEGWQESEARRLDLTHTLRNGGRPEVVRNRQDAEKLAASPFRPWIQLDWRFPLATR